MRQMAWLGLLVMGNAWAAPQTISSPVTRVSLLELYTSEGCSSCPPAEAWLSGLTDDKRLWKQLVPLAFHVDYWDYLGWRDPFDSGVYTRRQQDIDARAGNGVVYTPQFILNGEDWQSWFHLRPLDLGAAPKVGVLSFVSEGRKVTVHFIPSGPIPARLEVHLVLLAFGVDEPVSAGENKGVTLRHDFLVVSHSHSGLALNKDGYDASLNLSPPVAVKASYYALAGWVSAADDPTPIQAAGGRLAAAP